MLASDAIRNVWKCSFPLARQDALRACRIMYRSSPSGERSQISRNNLTFHSYSRLRVFGREFLMIMKMVIAPLTLVSLAVFLVYTEPHIPCVVMVLAKLAGHVSL